MKEIQNAETVVPIDTPPVIGSIHSIPLSAIHAYIMAEQKKPVKNDVTLSEEKLRKYFPRAYSPAKIEELVFKLLDVWLKQRQRDQSR